MRSAIQSLRRHLTSPKFSRQRGSVLILVVVMVVLLALLGTALLSTSRGDRYTTAQHTLNTQVDLLVDGMKQLTTGVIERSLYGNDYSNGGAGLALRAPADTATPAVLNDYANYDAVKTSAAADQLLNREWLSQRAPTLSVIAAGPPQQVRSRWLSVGTMLAGTTFESPVVWDSNGNVVTNASRQFTDRLATPGGFDFTPEAKRLSSDGKYYPAFANPWNGAPLVKRYYMAADADGDGIADSAYFRLPVGTIDGVTYYGAYRIVDANSAVNLNTAWSRSGDHLPGQQAVNDPTMPGGIVGAVGENLNGTFPDNLGWFESHVGLQEMLNRSDVWAGGAGTPLSTPYTFGNAGNWANERNASEEMLALNRARFGYDTTVSAGIAPADTLAVDFSPLYNTTIPPKNDVGASTATFGTYAGVVYLTQGDELQQQLANRLKNPGRLETTTPNVFNNFGSFAMSDALALAYHGGLMINPEAGKSLAEQTFFNARNIPGAAIPAQMPDSLYSSAANFRPAGAGTIAAGKANNSTGYSADQTMQWAMDYFNQDATAARNIYDPKTQAYVNAMAGSFSCVRPFVTTWSPTSNLIPAHALPGGVTNYTAAPSKVSVNTATFENLWGAFFNVMADRHTGTSGNMDDSYSPYGPMTVPATTADLYNGMHFNPVQGSGYPALYDTFDAQRMFRSSLRDVRPGAAPLYFSSTSQMLLRSALAAVQTLQLRTEAVTVNKNPAALPQYHDITLTSSLGQLKARVFGTAPQPFITEVFIQTDTMYKPDGQNNNPMGYIAVELYNPFDQAIVLDNSYELATINRHAGVYPLTATGLQNQPFDGTVTIAPYSYVLLENFGANITNAATYRPASTNLPQTGTLGTGSDSHGNGSSLASNLNSLSGVIPVDLSVIYNANCELILRRKLVAAPAQPIDYVPIDSIDLSSVSMIPNDTQARDWHYCRASGTALNNNWKCVYPGRYYGAQPGGGGAGTNPQQGFDFLAAWTMSASQDNDPWSPTALGGTPQQPPSAPIALGAADGDPSWQNPPSGNGGLRATYTIPLGGGGGSPGPFPLPTNPSNHFPYGAFAREGDMLQIPFIGGYTVQDNNAAPGLYETNSISADAAFAEDSDDADDEIKVTDAPNSARKNQNGAALPISNEVIGHFCPIIDSDDVRDDLDPANTYANRSWNYRWTTKLFDYLTVESPPLDYQPNLDPVNAAAGGLAAPQPVDNEGDTVANGNLDITVNPNDNAEDVVPRQGLININTAPWQVLAALPMMRTGNNNTLANAGVWNANGNPAADPADLRDDNVKLAQEIVKWRDGDPAAGTAPNGPFKSIFDLYRVPAFRGAQDILLDHPLGGATGIDRQQGDFSPSATADNGNDWARYDYEERFSLLNKISNLVTTRSDSYVVYVLVEGWRNVGTAAAERAVVRRAAFIQDRWGKTNLRSLNSPYAVPND